LAKPRAVPTFFVPIRDSGIDHMRFVLPLLAALLATTSLPTTANATPNDRGCGTRALVIDGVAGLRAMGAIGNDSMTEEADVAIKSAVLSCGGTYLLRAPDMTTPRSRVSSALGLSARLIAPIVRSLVVTRLAIGDSLAPIVTTLPMRGALTFAVDDVIAWTTIFPKAVREIGLRPPRVAVGRDSVQLWISAQF
jgi:hypothetical protein